MMDKPYFMENEAWFYFDENDWCYKLTKDAPEEAKESYNDYYTSLDAIDKGVDS